MLDHLKFSSCPYLCLLSPIVSSLFSTTLDLPEQVVMSCTMGRQYYAWKTCGKPANTIYLPSRMPRQSNNKAM
jgi:hypothetical protein